MVVYFLEASWKTDENREANRPINQQDHSQSGPGEYRVRDECVNCLALVRYLNQGSNPCTFPNSRTKNLAGREMGWTSDAYTFYSICRWGRSSPGTKDLAHRYWPCAHTWNITLERINLDLRTRRLSTKVARAEHAFVRLKVGTLPKQRPRPRPACLCPALKILYQAQTSLPLKV